MARTGYTLPVFAVAAAKAALLHLQGEIVEGSIELNLLPDLATIPIEQLAKLDPHRVLAIARSEPGDNLDLTRNTPIWATVSLEPRGEESLILLGGEGLGHDLRGNPAIYSYARQLFAANLESLIPSEQTAIITIILPEGRALAARTSNAAFGIVEGLSLLGTSGISQPFSAEDHLDSLRQNLREKAQNSKSLVFCIGSNGLRVADRKGIPPDHIVQTGNWIGALLLEAALQDVAEVLLLGYQGKLIKLAGGIFNTSSHLADAKLEIMAAALLRVGGDLETAQGMLGAKTADEGYKLLLERGWVQPVFSHLSATISRKATAYVNKYADRPLAVPTVLFDRQGQIIVGEALLDSRRQIP
jgi:cobalt-precorrin-5B (C1)-methyltransferase